MVTKPKRQCEWATLGSSFGPDEDAKGAELLLISAPFELPVGDRKEKGEPWWALLASAKIHQKGENANQWRKMFTGEWL